MVKTYLINGFLDAGKTTFIKELLQRDYFMTGEKTLLLRCEDGEEEYDADMLARNHVYLAEIDSEEDFNAKYIAKLEKEIHPARVIIEFNGMWNRKTVKLPWLWKKPIEVAVFDAATFELYSKNMKSLVAEQVRNASMVIFNRCDGLTDKLASYRRNIRAVNTDAYVAFEDKDGRMNPRFEEDLPYDISADEIEITDDSFALFYLDSMENVDRYIGKNVSLTGMVVKKKEDDPEAVIIGRLAMTCCAEDLSLFGFICEYEDACELEPHEWVSIQAVVDKDYDERYHLWYPILKIISCENCKKPKKEVVDII